MTGLLEELRGVLCRCGRGKKSMQTFCGECYHALPSNLQKALYRRMGEGYEEAYAAAVKWLKGDDPHSQDAT